MRWLWKDKENQRLLCLFISLAMASFICFKLIYPFPAIIPPESYSYLQAAESNQAISALPIGYSKFLNIIHCFSRSDILLSVVQYLLIQGSILYFLLTIRFLLSPGRWIYRVLFVLAVSNPLLPYVANFVTADCIAAALGLIWFTQLLWIIFKPTSKLIVTHAVVLLLAFMVKYILAYFYLVSLAVIWWISGSVKSKIAASGGFCFLFFVFIGFTQHEYKLKTGTVQYDALGGWATAAKALLSYEKAIPDHSIPLPIQFISLHEVVHQYLDSTSRLLNMTSRESWDFYLTDPQSPLLIYLSQETKKDSKKTFFEHWASVGALYGSYGRYLISNYSGSFTRYYMWPNFKSYFVPRLASFKSAVFGSNPGSFAEVSSYHWKDQRAYSNSGKERFMNNFYSVLQLVINLLFLFGVILIFALSNLKSCAILYKRIAMCVALTWIANIVVSVWSIPVEPRYQIFSITFTTVFSILFIVWFLDHFFNCKNEEELKCLDSSKTSSVNNQNSDFT